MIDAPGARSVSCRWELLKRSVDLVIASLLILATLPLLAVLVLLVRFTSRGRVFDPQMRLGQFGRPFRLWKLRVRRMDLVGNYRNCLRGDPRLTSVGQVLKLFHLDALPALWNVVRGDLSLVGPKPDRPELAPMYELSVRDFSERMLVRPGLTGLSQVCLPPEAGLPGIRRRVHLDLHYVRHANAWLDTRLLVGHCLAMLGVDRSTVRSVLFLPAPGQESTPAPTTARVEPNLQTSAQLSA